MTRIVTVAALALLWTAPAGAQWLGVPAWNSPKGGAGITVSADFGTADYNSDTDPLEAKTFGARGSVGLGKATITVGLSSFNPKDTLLETVTAFGAQGAYRVIGGSLLPVAVNLQAGVSRHGVVDGGSEKITNWLVGVGISTSLPTPAVSLEPYLSVSNRWHRDGRSQSNVGFVIGANINFGTFGLHLAYDSEKDDDGGRLGIFGVGAHVGLRAPVGM